MLLLFIIIIVTFFGRKWRYFLTVLQFFVLTCFNIYIYIYLFTMIGIFPIHVLFIGLKLLSMYYLLATEALGKLHPSI